MDVFELAEADEGVEKSGLAPAIEALIARKEHSGNSLDPKGAEAYILQYVIKKGIMPDNGATESTVAKFCSQNFKGSSVSIAQL